MARRGRRPFQPPHQILNGKQGKKRQDGITARKVERGKIRYMQLYTQLLRILHPVFRPPRL